MIKHISKLGMLFASTVFFAAYAAEYTELSRSQLENLDAATGMQLETVSQPNNTWSYKLPGWFNPETRVKGNILTWQYIGQARFSKNPKAPTSERTWQVEEDLPVSKLDQLTKMVRIDKSGRKWKVTGVDIDAWQRAVNYANQISKEEQPGNKQSARIESPELEPGSLLNWKPTSWSHLNCDADGGNETHLWEGDNSDVITNGHTPIQSTAVEISNTVTNSECSGVMIRQKYILTAAHCVSDDSNNPVPIFNNFGMANINVCRDDLVGAHCIAAVSAQFPNSYGGGSAFGGGTDFRDDWAILELWYPWETAGWPRAEVMDMSSAADSTLDALTQVHSLGFPGFDGSCNNMGADILVHNIENEPIVSTRPNKIKFKLDSAPGISGGPIYYCPENDNDLCLWGEQGYVYSLHAGYNSSGKRTIGPKVAAFRDAAIAFIND